MKIPPECGRDEQGRMRHYFVWGALPYQVSQAIASGHADPVAATPAQPTEPPPETTCVCGAQTWAGEKAKWLGI